MIWANKNNERIKATPRNIAICPICQKEVIAKCGSIKVWHWSHKSLKDCDDWAEPESEWHYGWKQLFPKEQQEVKMGKHRADIKTRSGTIIELQNSSIDIKTLRQREDFYGDMIWLLNGSTIAKHFYFNIETKYMRWLWKPAIVKYSNKPIFIDYKDKIVKYSEIKFGCTVFSKEQFLKLYGDIYGNQ